MNRTEALLQIPLFDVAYDALERAYLRRRMLPEDYFIQIAENPESAAKNPIGVAEVDDLAELIQKAGIALHRFTYVFEDPAAFPEEMTHIARAIDELGRRGRLGACVKHPFEREFFASLLKLAWTIIRKNSEASELMSRAAKALLALEFPSDASYGKAFMNAYRGSALPQLRRAKKPQAKKKRRPHR